MVDDKTDLAKIEKWYSAFGTWTIRVHKEVIGLQSWASTSAGKINANIGDIMLYMDHRRDNFHSQCYEGDSNMFGV